MDNHPLRLAIGSHDAGSGRGCAMNVVSWENGDTQITDYPDCADPVLARIVQRVNDSYCMHLDDDLLCPSCSIDVLSLAHRTTGTALTDWANEDRVRVYATIALECAESVLHLTTGADARRACALAREFLTGESVDSDVLTAAADAAYAAADAAYAAADAAYAAYAAAAYAADAAADAADAAASAVYAAIAVYAAAEAVYAAIAADAANVDRLKGAHHVIDRFEELTGIKAVPTEPEVTARAVAQMTA